MAYKGMPIFKQEELTSLKRMRESAGVLPDGSGFFTATVQTPKTKEAGVRGMKWGVHSGKKEPVSNSAHQGLTKHGFKLKSSGSTPSGKGAYSVYEHPDGHSARVQKSSTETRVSMRSGDGKHSDSGGARSTPDRFMSDVNPKTKEAGVHGMKWGQRKQKPDTGKTRAVGLRQQGWHSLDKKAYVPPEFHKHYDAGHTIMTRQFDTEGGMARDHTIALNKNTGQVMKHSAGRAYK
jgi:hypothetical protein